MRILPFHYYIPTVQGILKNRIAHENIYPFYASFKITSRCHFRCPFCNMRHSKTDDLSADDICKILDNLSRSSVLMVSFEGGEPLLREDIGDLLRYARTCKFYLLFTTSVKNILDFPIDEYAKYIDFLHVSIDEGHNNPELFSVLPDLTKIHPHISVQTVVTSESIQALQDKVERCNKYGVNIVIIPAAAMEAAEDCFPDITELEKKINGLREVFPNTIHTPEGYFKAYRKHACSSASVIIAPDGRLFYPCHILNQKGPDLRTVDITQWLSSQEAKEKRMSMRTCTRNCGWYQYYSIDSYLSLHTAYRALKPMLFQGKKG